MKPGAEKTELYTNKKSLGKSRLSSGMDSLYRFFGRNRTSNLNDGTGHAF
jgi:hypothetical protein